MVLRNTRIRGFQDSISQIVCNRWTYQAGGNKIPLKTILVDRDARLARATAELVCARACF